MIDFKDLTFQYFRPKGFSNLLSRLKAYNFKSFNLEI